MAGSFADQLLKAGLVNKKSVQNAKKTKQKNAKLERKGNIASDESTAARLAADKASQVERDRQLNLQRTEQQRERENKIQVAQLLTQHRITGQEGDVKYHYTDAHTQKIKSLYVTELQQEQLARGIIAVCTDGEKTLLVPRIIADKAMERYPLAVSYIATANDALDVDAEEDPYKDYQIPDDLMW